MSCWDIGARGGGYKNLEFQPSTFEIYPVGIYRDMSLINKYYALGTLIWCCPNCRQSKFDTERLFIKS